MHQYSHESSRILPLQRLASFSHAEECDEIMDLSLPIQKNTSKVQVG